MKYDYTVFDTTYLLRRNFSKIDYGNMGVVKSIVYSIGKTIRENVEFAGKIILAWDTPPYHRTVALDGAYKDDRIKYTQEDLELAYEDEEANSELIDEIEAFLIKAEREKAITSFFFECMSAYGLVSLRKEGFEADDIAYMLTEEIPKDKNILLVSVDGDWKYNVSDNVHFLRLLKSGAVLMTKEEEFTDREYLPVKAKHTYKEFGWLMESLSKGHNGMRRALNTVGLQEFLNMEDEEKKKEYVDSSLFERQYNTFDYTKFSNVEEMRQLMAHVLTGGELGDIDDFDNFSTFSGLGVSRSYYVALLTKLNKEQYKHPITLNV